MIINCELCKKGFYKRPSHFKRVKRHFCSNYCKGQIQRGDNSFLAKDSWIKTCLFCSKKYRYRDSKGKKFCSQSCMGQYKHAKQSSEVICVICKKTKRLINALILKENTCSNKCASILHGKRMSNEGNSNWRGGIGKLPWGFEFTKLLKYKIKRRDNFKCRLCGKSNHELFESKGYGLTIHHVDYNKNNNKESNLISLCDVCHGKTGYNRNTWIQKFKAILSQ